MSGYTDLQAHVTDWLARSTDTALLAQVDTFIYNCELTINRRLRHPRMEGRAKINTLSGDDYIEMPDGFLEMRNLQYNGTEVYPLQYLPPEGVDAKCKGPGEPLYYTISGNAIQVYPLPSGEFEIEMLYYKRIEHLHVEPDNWLTSYGGATDLLLYGSLMHAESWLMNDERIALWATAFEKILSELNADAKKQRFSGSSLVMRRA